MSRIVSQYAAAQESGVTRQAIYRQSKKIPMPPWFVITKEGLKVEADHPVFLLYCEKQRLKRRGELNDELTRVVRVTIEFLREYIGLTGDELKSAINEIQRRYDKQRR